MKATKSQIEAFTSQKHIAVAGVSRNPKKFGNEVFRHLGNVGYHAYPINPNLDEVEGVKCYRTVNDLPADVTALHINTKPEHAPDLVKDAHSKGITHIWMQQGAGNKEAYEYAKSNGLNVISGKCIMMFTGELKGPHKFHAFIQKLFGAYPR